MYGVAGFCLCTLTAWFGLLGNRDSLIPLDDYSANVQMALRHPFISEMIIVTLFFSALGLIWGAGLPYRHKMVAPSITPHRCGSCNKEILDQWNCSECGAFRPSRIFTFTMMVLNSALSLLWMAHDGMLMVLTSILL